MAFKCVLIKWNEPEKLTFEEVNMDTQLENPNVIGLDPDLEYLVKREPFVRPNYDTRLQRLVITQDVVDEVDAEYPPLRKWETTYSLIERTADEKKTSVNEAENIAASRVFPLNQQLRYLAMYAIILRREVLGLSVTPAMQQVIDKVEAKGLLIWQNYIAGKAKKAEIDLGNIVDLDADWEDVNPDPND